MTARVFMCMFKVNRKFRIRYLIEYFSSVFTSEDISALPVPKTKFKGRESDYLGKLIITPK